MPGSHEFRDFMVCRASARTPSETDSRTGLYYLYSFDAIDDELLINAGGVLLKSTFMFVYSFDSLEGNSGRSATERYHEFLIINETWMLKKFYTTVMKGKVIITLCISLHVW